MTICMCANATPPSIKLSIKIIILKLKFLVFSQINYLVFEIMYNELWNVNKKNISLRIKETQFFRLIRLPFGDK